MELCNSCESRKKVKYTTFFECVKYGMILDGNPPKKCWKCLENEIEAKKASERKTKKKKEFIEVK